MQTTTKKLINKDVTIYTTSEFFGSVVAHRGKLLAHGVIPYAQYKSVPYVEFIPKGKRKIVRLQKSYKPYLIIVKGYNTPEPSGMFAEPKTENGVIIKKSQYVSFDDNYKTDFDKILSQSDIEIIADYRE